MCGGFVPLAACFRVIVMIFCTFTGRLSFPGLCGECWAVMVSVLVILTFSDPLTDPESDCMGHMFQNHCGDILYIYRQTKFPRSLW